MKIAWHVEFSSPSGMGRSLIVCLPAALKMGDVWNAILKDLETRYVPFHECTVTRVERLGVFSEPTV